MSHQSLSYEIEVIPNRLGNQQLLKASHARTQRQVCPAIVEMSALAEGANMMGMRLTARTRGAVIHAGIGNREADLRNCCTQTVAR